MSLPCCLRPRQLVEDRAEFGFVADQLVVVELLELGVAVLDEAVADRVAEEAAFGIAAHVAHAGAMTLGHRAGDHGAVGGEDPAALDLLLLEQRALVGFFSLSALASKTDQ